MLERDRGDFAAAEALYREALPIVQRTLGRQHWRTARLMGNLAYLRTLEGRLDEAEALLREATAIVRAGTGGDRSLEAGLKIETARIHLARHEAAAAEPLLRDAIAGLQRSYPAGAGESRRRRASSATP
ncbi:tetratricopeptide repeat protein [Oleiharenicola sp. Vm1]|uniref:tetratricopeptide repeat protein n=1 Tax=Oleiharenicola sp. Vm1 TaxID=3398393 RepID=UPI0039F491F6